MGPNVKKLICQKMAKDAIPPQGGMADAIKFLSDKESIIAKAKEAQEWVLSAISAVKTAPGNPYGNDDEAIAGEILQQLEAKKRK